MTRSRPASPNSDRTSAESTSSTAFSARWAAEEGVAAVEFALILPLLLALVFGIIDYGYYFLLDMECTHAAREGARKGAVEPTFGSATATAQTAAQGYLTGVGLGAGANVPTVAAATAADGNGGNNLAVTVTLSAFAPLVGFVPVPSRILASSKMHYEGVLP